MMNKILKMPQLCEPMFTKEFLKAGLALEKDIFISLRFK